MALHGRSAIITGANQGLGLAIARRFVKSGANVLLAARDKERLHQAEKELQRLARPEQIIVISAGDVSRPEDCQAIICRALRALSGVMILVNNAGVYGPIGQIEDNDWDAWVQAIQINLFGTVLMCRAIMPHLRQQGYGKIVNLSGGGATSPLPRFSSYAASKAAVVRFTETLAEEVREHHIDVNAIAPGPLNTRLLDQVLEAGPERTGQAFYERSLKQREEGGAPLEKGAALAEFLASAASDGITGKLLSAVWDQWTDLPARRQHLDKSDIFTLRRIVPEDRGQKWQCA
jgi:NAD(P)-dependent dehydrogenase (short-subunit alcohol dehydrogenase family)